MKSNRVTKERHKALIEDYVAQLEQADTDKVRATSGSDAVTTLSLDAVRLPPPATPGAGALGDDVPAITAARGLYPRGRDNEN